MTAARETAPPVPARSRRRDAVAATLVFLVVFVGHFGFGITTSFDSRYVPHIAMSILKRQTTTLDAYPGITPDDNAIRIVDGHKRSFFPIGTPLLAVPFVAAIDVFTSRLLSFQSGGRYVRFELDDLLQRGIANGVERFIAAIWMGVASVLLYFIARESLTSRARCVLVALVFAFATQAWSTASRGLWQHGPSMLLLATTLLLLVRARRRPSLAAFAALPIAYSYVVRPTNSLSLVAFTLYIAIAHRRQLPLYFALAATIAVPFVAYNWSVYGAILPPYYRAGHLEATSRFFWVWPTNWISPSRGLLVFTPVFVFSLWGAWIRVREGSLLDRFVAGVILLHSIAISSTKLSWHADMCFGPRYFSDVTPLFIWFLIPAVERVAQRRALIVVFALLAAISFAIHRRGATSWEVYQWNLTPVYIDHRPSRAWDVRDVQFLRGL